MSLDGLVPLEISDFGGLYTSIATLLDAPVSTRRVRGRGRGLFVSPTALDAKNLRYLRGGFVTRPGLESVFTGTAATGAKATHIGQLITQEDERQVLVVTSDGQLWREPDAGVALTNLKSDWAKSSGGGGEPIGATIGHSATLFDREHLAISDSQQIGVGQPVVWNRTNLDKLSPSGPGKAHTLAAGAAGVVTNGLHKVVTLFVTRNGYISNASDPVEITVAGNTKIDVSNIPTGPDWVVQRIVAMTEADGANYFYDPDTMVLDNNTATTLTIDVADASLVALNNVNDRLRLEPLADPVGLLAYNDRMVAWGLRKRIPLPNTDFDGGFGADGSPVDANIPAGWTDGSGGIGGHGKETSTVYLGHAYRIDGDGVNKNGIGDIRLAISREFAQAHFPLGTKYRIRARLRRNAAATGTGETALRMSLAGIGGVSLSVRIIDMDTATYETFIGTGTTISSTFPTELVITISDPVGSGSAIPAGGSVFIEDVTVFPDEEPFQSSLVRISNVNEPEAFDGVTGFISVRPDDGEKVVSCFVFRGMLFIVKERGLHVTKDDGVNPPAFWRLDFVDKVGCDSVHSTAVAGQSFALILYHDGIYVIRGLLPQDISDELQDSPVGLPSMDDRNNVEAYRNHIAIEDEKTEAHFAIVQTGDTWPERVFKLNYRHGWGMEQRRWSYDEFKIGASDLTVGASALIQEATKQRIFFGAETGDIERHEGNDDLGNDIATNWRSAYLSYLGLAGARGKSIFGAVVLHGETLGTSPELDINGYKMDNTQVVLINNATLSLATLFERRINQIVEKMSFEINVAGTGDPRVAIDSFVLYGRPFHLSGPM